MERSVEMSSWADFLTASTGVSTLIALLCLAKLQASYFPTLPGGARHCIMSVIAGYVQGWCDDIIDWHGVNWERWRHSKELGQSAIHWFQVTGLVSVCVCGGVIGPFTHYQLYSSNLLCLLEYADNSICGSYDMAVLSGYPFKLLDCQPDVNPTFKFINLILSLNMSPEVMKRWVIWTY